MESEFARLELEAMRAVYQRQSEEVSADMQAQLDAALNEYAAISEDDRIAAMAPRFIQICSACELSAFEADVLLLALAPVWNPEIEEAYAALSDRDYRGLTPGIAGRIFAQRGEGFVAALYRALAPDSALLRHRLLRMLDTDMAVHTARFAVDARIVQYLQGSDDVPARLQGIVQLRLPSAAASVADQGSEPETPNATISAALPARVASALSELAGSWQGEREAVAADPEGAAALLRPTIVQLCGPARNGQHESAAYFADALGLPLLYIEGNELRRRCEASSANSAGASEARDMLRELTREALLYDAISCVSGWATLRESDVARDWLQSELPLLPAPALLETPESSLALNTYGPEHQAVRVWDVDLPALNSAERTAIWEQAVRAEFLSSENTAAPLSLAPDVALSAFGSGFRFTARQTRAALQRAVDRAKIESGGRIDRKLLLEACYAESNRELGDLAVRVRSRPAWGDLVLRPEALRQLSELCDQARHSGRVNHEWGFARSEGDAVGLHALFAGAPGTGKTMAAAVVAAELGLEMYRIELSAVVSKYIGETEKNLARIFAEAETSNAVLFFDEADALFGKRGEVKDAQDRYANMEVSYLLQKMEEYPGITILATNFRANLDKAFVRRLHFIVDFPFPDANERLEIWERNFPARAPLATDVDLAFLAARLDVPGALIRNIARGAAFLAAAEDSSIALRHIRRAAAREYKKDRRPVPDFSVELSAS